MKSQTKVGILFFVAFLGVIGFAYALGSLQFFSNAYDLNVAFNFAGGIEVGSPVRVMGIKVGKVRSVDFQPDFKMPETGEEVKLMVRITIDKKAWATLKTNSQYFINLAGVIGEKFLEISPGTSEGQDLKPGQVVRGEDPPRIDQLISQSYSLAGKILEFVNKNEGSVIGTIDTLNKLVTNFDKALRQLEKTSRDANVVKIVKNIGSLTDDMAFFSQKMRSPEGQRTLALINELIRRLEPLDGKQVKKFLQEEGIKAKLF